MSRALKLLLQHQRKKNIKHNQNFVVRARITTDPRAIAIWLSKFPYINKMWLRKLIDD